jgi:O-antigen ligase
MGDGDETHGHNDWLEMLTQTGLIGFALFVALQILLFRAILRLDRKERFVFLAMLVAVNVMMFFSNSYAWRIQVSHLYYIILAYVELRRPDRGIETVSASTAANVSGGPVEQRPTITRGTSHYRLGARDG